MEELRVDLLVATPTGCDLVLGGIGSTDESAQSAGFDVQGSIPVAGFAALRIFRGGQGVVRACGQ